MGQLTQIGQKDIQCHITPCLAIYMGGFGLSKVALAQRVTGHQSAGGKW